MNSSNYLLDLKISGDDLRYIDNIFKFISSSQSTRAHIIKITKMLEKELFSNEHYIIYFYIEFMTQVKNLGKIDLNSIKRLIALDREMFTNNPNITQDFGITVRNEDRGELLEQLVVEKLKNIEDMEEVSEEDYDLAVQMLGEIIEDLKVKNLIYASSLIFFEGKKIGRKEYKGREGYLEFMRKGMLDINSLNSGEESVIRVDKEYILLNTSTSSELFDHPLKTITESWGKVREGDSISLIAGMNVGKTTVAFNYLAESLMAGVNTGLFISEMSFTRVMSRVITIIGARKYDIRIPTAIAMRYLEIESKKIKGTKMDKSDGMFLSNHESIINNIEYILTAIQSESNKELGTLFRKPELVLEDLDAEFELMKKQNNISFLVADHVNGITSRYGVSDTERINGAYIAFNSLGKKYGIANLITNHIPEKQKEGIVDKQEDLVNVRGFRGSESINSPDYVIIINASSEQKSRGEFVVNTNKDRNTNTFFEPFLASIHTDVGMIYEADID